CRGLEITFNPGVADARKALDGLDFSLAEREFAVAIGSNGAGKSTLLNAIAGSVTLDRGSIRLGDRDLTRLAPYRR
ncbi:MAG: ATP-binding cassette domain-containing protein, partial [Rhizobiaceae bacterium]|nr:ATP-binding cassette domain-containing protein [Rhizobiaceae bacterium]